MMQTINIAIDGPAGAGKSTIAKRAARELGYIYADTGALYRAIGLAALRGGIDTYDTAAICALLPRLTVSLEFRQGEQRVLLNGEDVSDEIRSPEVSMAASAVSAIPAVRDFLLQLQKDIATQNNCIMDGRDIGTVVLPNAQVKIFLTASAEERATRRLLELWEKGQQMQYETVLAQMRERDYNDANRAAAPMIPAQDSVLVDTTGLDLEQSVRAVRTVIQERIQTT